MPNISDEELIRLWSDKSFIGSFSGRDLYINYNKTAAAA